MTIKDTKFDDFLVEQLNNPEIKREYDRLAPEYAFKQFLIDFRVFSSHLRRKRRPSTQQSEKEETQ